MILSLFRSLQASMTQLEVSYPYPLVVIGVSGFQLGVASRIDFGLFMKSAYDSAVGIGRSAPGVVKSRNIRA